MVTPAEIMDIAAADMNDAAQTNYTDTALLPYLNMAIEELIQRMEENNLPVTNKTSANIEVLAGQTEIAFAGTSAQLPADLIEPEMLWESDDDGTTWTPMTKVEQINPNIATGQELSMFGVYEWQGDKIVVPQSTNDIIIQIRYIRKLINTPLTTSQVDVPLQINAKLFLGHKTGALCAMLSAQNETRAGALNELAEQAIEREMNIPTKGRQNIATRRRPFRQNFKSIGSW